MGMGGGGGHYMCLILHHCMLYKQHFRFSFHPWNIRVLIVCVELKFLKILYLLSLWIMTSQPSATHYIGMHSNFSNFVNDAFPSYYILCLSRIKNCFTNLRTSLNSVFIIIRYRTSAKFQAYKNLLGCMLISLINIFGLLTL